MIKRGVQQDTDRTNTGTTVKAIDRENAQETRRGSRNTRHWRRTFCGSEGLQFTICVGIRPVSIACNHIQSTCLITMAHWLQPK